MCLECSEYTKATRNQKHLAKCSEIESALKELTRGLASYRYVERDLHIWLDVILNDKMGVKRPEE